MKAADISPEHFDWSVDRKVATVALNRPERKNPLTLESYAELRDTFRQLVYMKDIKAVIFTGTGEDFCSRRRTRHHRPAYQHEMDDLLEFTQTDGRFGESHSACPQPVIAAIDGICAGAGACIAMAADMRYGTERSKVAFLFNRVGLAGCDMGACAMLPRIIGQGRASELLFTGRAMAGEEAERWGFYNKLATPDELHLVAMDTATGFLMVPLLPTALPR